MSDIRIDTGAPRAGSFQYQQPGGFWRDVWKMTLGVCFGTLLASLIAGLAWWAAVGLFVVKAASAVQEAVEAAEDRAILRTNELIREYERVAAGDADEADKAAAASRVAAACRQAMDSDQAEFWEKSAQIHREAAATGKKTRPKK